MVDNWGDRGGASAHGTAGCWGRHRVAAQGAGSLAWGKGKDGECKKVALLY